MRHLSRSSGCVPCVALLLFACGGSGRSARKEARDAGEQTGSGGLGSGGLGSGGLSSTGGQAAGGRAGAGSGGAPQKPPPHVVTACDKLPAVGVWENITPSNVDLSEFGVASVVFDPNNSSTVYLGGETSGLQKTTDCGATWVHIDTGTLGADIDKGRLSLVLDPINPNVIYTNSLYGTNGFFKSTNGGVDWAQILTPEITKYAPYGGFVGGIAMDPNDHLHLILTWHQVCASPYTSACYAETADGGTTWTMRNGDPSWNGGEGTFMQFLDSDTWLFSSSTNGMWRTADRGGHWAQIAGVKISHGAGQLYRTAKGAFFLGSATGVLYSADGVSWTTVPNSGTLISGVAGDGTTVWASNAFPYNIGDHPAPFLPYLQASEGDPMTWTTFTSPKMTSGGATLAYDPDHHLLYSANFWEGIWRVVVK